MGDLFNICVTCMTLYNLSVTLLNDNSEDQTDHFASCWLSHPLLIMMFVLCGTFMCLAFKCLFHLWPHLVWSYFSKKAWNRAVFVSIFLFLCFHLPTRGWQNFVRNTRRIPTRSGDKYSSSVISLTYPVLWHY